MYTTVSKFYYYLDKKQRTIFRKNVQNMSGLNYYKFFIDLKTTLGQNLNCMR